MPEVLLRHDWTRAEIAALFALPFNDLLYRAHTVHAAHHVAAPVGSGLLDRVLVNAQKVSRG